MSRQALECGHRPHLEGGAVPRPPPKAELIRVRTIALILSLSLLVAIATPLASAQAEDPPRFVYGGAEVTRYYNEHHDPNITLVQGRQAAAYFNGLVVAYLRAVERAQLVGRWLPVARCESGDNIYAVSSSGTYRGWLQFSRSSWNANGGSGDPYGQSRYTAARVAENYRLRAGTSPWPHCGAYYG